MILVKNKWFPFGNYKAINICGIVFYKGDNLSDKTINHEKIHTKQMIELLFIFFYLWYGIEYLIIRLFHKKQNDVYHDVSFEEEAHNNDDNLNYIDTRKHYAWFKYIKVKASKGVAGAGLGLGIAGTALWLLSGGLGGGLFGNRFGAAGAAALGAESTVEKEDKCELVNGMWQLAFNGQTARFNDRNQINAEIFGIYKSQVDADFGLYNSNITFWDVYVAFNAQYHDNIELYKEWFGEDNIENIKDKIIESAIVNWFEDEDAGIEKVWNYFRAI